MDSLWPSLAAELKKELPAQQFDTWIRPLRAERHDDQLVLVAPNHHVLRWVRANLLARIESRVERVAGSRLSVNLVLEERPSETEIVVPEPVPVPVAANDRPGRDEHRLNPGFTFANFVNGKANQIARAAAIQVAENPGTAYNPLFIYGGTGLGKTHLLQAIGIEVLKRNPKAKVRYIHAEQFVADVVRAYQHKSFDSLKRYYRSLDLFLIDDVQFFVGKSRSQEEFFYTFNALFEAHKQVAITSDCFPKEMTGIEERLISRFGWGLTVAVEPPELEMRVAILLKKAENDGVRVDENVAFFIAKHIRSNVRELEGALKRVLAYARFNNATVNVTTAPRGPEGPARRPQSPGFHREHPEDGRRLLQDQGLGHVLEEALPLRGPSAASGHGARQGAHPAKPAGNRRSFRRPRPYDRPACLPQDAGAARDGPGIRARLRATAADTAGMSHAQARDNLWIVSPRRPDGAVIHSARIAFRRFRPHFNYLSTR